MANYLTSETLIESAKNRALIPDNQVTFDMSDFLRFINEELIIGLVPSMLVYHDDYLLFTEDIPLVNGKSNYKIPYRAIGNKLRDVFYRDLNGNLYEMSRIPIDDVVEYQGSITNTVVQHYFLKNNEVNLVPAATGSNVGSLRFAYYFRPNDLVASDEVCFVQSINEVTGEIFVDSIPETFSLVKMDFIEYQTPFRILEYDVTPSNLNSSTNIITFTTPLAITGNITNTSNVITNLSTVTGLIVGQSISGIGIPDSTTITSIDSSTQITVSNAATATTATLDITVAVSNIPEDLNIGDQISLAGETNVPQLPSDVHVILAHRVAIRCLEALGDTQGLQNAMAKLQEMDTKLGNLVDNRVEGSPVKVSARWTPLRQSSFRRWSRFGRG